MGVTCEVISTDFYLDTSEVYSIMGLIEVVRVATLSPMLTCSRLVQPLVKDQALFLANYELTVVKIISHVARYIKTSAAPWLSPLEFPASFPHQLLRRMHNTHNIVRTCCSIQSSACHDYPRHFYPGVQSNLCI